MRIGDTATVTMAAGAEGNPCPAGQLLVGSMCLPPAPEQQGEVTGGHIVSWSQVCAVGQIWNPITQQCMSMNWLYIAAAVLGGYVILKQVSGGGSGAGKKGRR